MEQARNILSGSVICRGMAALWLWCAALWRNSCTARLCARAGGWLERTFRRDAPWLRWLVLRLEGSLIWRLAMALCGWCGRQWRSSAILRWFLHPAGWSRAASESSVFFRLWSLLRGGLCWLYEKLGLERVFAGSMFGAAWFWCALPAALAPLLPTMGVLALEAVGCCALLLALVRDRKRALAWSPVNRYIILYAAVYLIAAFCSVDRQSSLKPGLLTAAFVLFALVLFNGITSRAQLSGVVTAMLVAAAAVSLYGILQYVFGWGYQSESWVDSDMFSTISFRVASTMDNPNMLGQYLVLMIPLGGARLLSSKTWPGRLLSLLCCGLMCACMLLTLSRGAWLGLLFAGAVFFVMLAPRLVLLAPPAVAALFLAMPATIFARFTSIGNMGDSSTYYRVSIWLGSLAMLHDYWLCGVGPGEAAFNRVYPAYDVGAANAHHSHNLYLQLMCDGGVVVLAVFAMILFVFFRLMCTRISREREWAARLHQIALVSGMLGFLAQGMTDFSFYNYRVMFLFWVCLALGALYARWGELPERGRPA